MHIHETACVLTPLNQIPPSRALLPRSTPQTSARMGYVVIFDIEADGDVAEKALLAMKAIPGNYLRPSAVLPLLNGQEMTCCPSFLGFPCLNISSCNA